MPAVLVRTTGIQLVDDGDKKSALRFCGIFELGFNPACGNRHNNCPDTTDFSIGEPYFLSIAKAMDHSRVAADRQGCGQVDHTGASGVQHIVLPDRIHKRCIRLLLLFG
jgi:hypothetical protein